MAASPRSDEEWEKYAAKWGVTGEFTKAEIDSSLLAQWAETGVLGTSRQLAEQTIADKQSGKSPIGPAIITRTPNERSQTFVIDGTHSLAARIRSHQQASADAKDYSKSLEERRAARKIRDANAKTEVIISKEAAEYLNLDFGGDKPKDEKGFNPAQPRVPAGSPAGGQFSSNHAAASSRILSKIDAALAKGDPVFGEPLKEHEVAAFRSAFSATLGGLNEKAITSLESNLEDAHFYPNSLWLTHKIAGAKHAQEGKLGVHGAWEYSEQTGSGKLHLDGGVGDKATRLTPEAIRHVYAHEVAHAIDWVPDSAGGGGHAISSTTKWGEAYAAELKSGSLSTYATTSASEGFAEFGRLANHSPAIARERFPRCAAVWAEHGLID